MTAPSLSRLYGRRKGRPLRLRKSRLMEELLPAVRVTVPEKGALNPAKLMSPKPRVLWLEVGFGGGEHLAALAKRHPDIGFVGCEPFINGVASLLDHIEREQVSNIRIFPDDARILFERLPEASIARCFILFPDPWPKARHAKRRFINPENILRLARILKPHAELRLATDDAKLVFWIRQCLQETRDFSLAFDSADPPEDWVPTRYEQKALQAGRKPVYMGWRRA